jgi:hypothetical protein
MDCVDASNLATAAPLLRMQINTLVRACYAVHAPVADDRAMCRCSILVSYDGRWAVRQASIVGYGPISILVPKMVLAAKYRHH